MRKTLAFRSVGQWLVLLIIACYGLASCSRSDSVFEEQPSYSAVTRQSVTSVAACVADRLERSTRRLRQSKIGQALRLEGETFFRGVPIGVSVFRAMGRTHVQFFQERSTDHIYVSFVKGCLQPDM